MIIAIALVSTFVVCLVGFCAYHAGWNAGFETANDMQRSRPKDRRLL